MTRDEQIAAHEIAKRSAASWKKAFRTPAEKADELAALKVDAARQERAHANEVFDAEWAAKQFERKRAEDISRLEKKHFERLAKITEGDKKTSSEAAAAAARKALERDVAELGATISALAQAVAAGHSIQETTITALDLLGKIAAAQAAPKTRIAVRDAKGDILHTIEVPTDEGR